MKALSKKEPEHMKILSLLEKVVKSSYDGKDSLEGYIQFDTVGTDIEVLQKEIVENGKGDKEVFTLRLNDALNKRFDKAAKFESTTKSKVLRSLIEFYIVQVEKDSLVEENKLRAMLTLDDMQQAIAVDELSDKDKLEFLKMKRDWLEAKIKEDKINKKTS